MTRKATLTETTRFLPLNDEFAGFVLLTQPHVVAHLEAAALKERGWDGIPKCPPDCPGLPEADAA